MSAKTQYYAQMAAETAGSVTGTYQAWTGFLTTAARNYKYSYDEQLMIYAQRPDATACAEYGLWNKTMGRYVKRGAKGIALLDNTGSYPKLHYVFDVSDTGARRNSRPVHLWKMENEYQEPVQTALERTYGVSAALGLQDQLEQIAQQLAVEYWQEYGHRFLDIVADSYLEGYDEYNIEVAFRRAVSISAAYQLSVRCTGDPDDYFEHEDFLDVFDFNTRQTASALGTAVSSISSQVLREIEIAIRNYERTKAQERSQNHERTELYPERGLPDSRPSTGTDGAEAPGQVRQDAPGVPSGERSDALQRPVPDRETVPPSVGGAGDSRPAHGADDVRVAGEEPGPGQENRPDGLGAAYEHPESPGGGSDRGGADYSVVQDGSGQISLLFPSEAEQIESIDHDEAESAQPSAFSISDTEINRALRGGSGYADGKLRIYTLYQQEGDPKARAKYLKAEYGTGGRSYQLRDGTNGFVDYGSKGLKLRSYEHDTERRLSWTEVEERIHTLILADAYLTAPEKARYEQLEQDYAGMGGVPLPGAGHAFPPPVLDVPDTGNDHVDEMLAEARQIAEDSQLAPMERFIVMETEGGYALWDNIRDEIYVDDEGVSEEFDSEWQAETYRREVIQKVEAQETAEWLYVEQTKQGVPPERREPAPSQAVSGTETGQTPDEIPAETAGDTPAPAVPETEENGDSDKLRTATRMADVLQPGQTVYLEDTAYVVERVWMFDVELRDPTQSYPIFRAENKDRLESLLRQDERNSWLLGYVVPVQDEPAPSQAISGTKDGQSPNKIPAETAGDTPVTSEIEETADGGKLRSIVIDLTPRGEPEHQPEPLVEAEPEIPARNFHITDDHLGEGGPKTKYARNVVAIRTLYQLEAENRNATPEEQEILSQFVGWGGLADAFNPNNDAWAKEYAELKELLPETEYEMARSSVLNAHYTTPTVIRAIYDVVGQMGFKTGNILEPSCGVGNFFGMLPDTMRDSRLYGVELDSITGRIAQKLYPNAEITVAGFETTDRRDFYDLSVGNVPFGNYQVNDKPYNKLGFSIHNYFFAKALDQVRPGGVVAFVTSRYTMDAKSPDVRKYLAQRAELLGAIRLPNNAFRANAGTDVVSDIIFLQKREHPIDIEPDWVHLGQTPEGLTLNSYFVDHPEMVLGELTTQSTQYGREKCTVVPIEGADLGEQLKEAVSHIHGSYTAVTLSEPEIGDAPQTIPADPSVKNFSYAVVDGEVYFRENSVMRPVELTGDSKERVKGMVALRQIVNELIEYQLEDFPDDRIEAKQRELNAAYDAFTEKYGILNSRANARVFEEDSSYYLLCSLENVNEDGKLESKADMFTKRTIRPERRVTSVDTPSEALAISIGERGRVDLAFMAELLGMPGDYDAITGGLQGIIFKDPLASEEPEAGWQTADEYLSGNVREKLRTARLAAERDGRFSINVEALEQAQPKDLDASEIEVRLGARWIEPRYIQQFMQETFDTPFYMRRNIQVNYTPMTDAWQITGKSVPRSDDVAAYTTYGTGRANAYKILEETLNLKDIRIYDYYEDSDGKKKRVLNKKETTLAQQKQQAIKDAFRDWIWRDPRRREALVTRYNELFNSTRPREYDGSHIHFVGMNPDIQLRPHQLGAIAHVLYGGNTLLAHEVGAGKTFEMAAAAMESKRLGLCQKSMFVVPNHLTLQWANEFLRLYPSAKLLVTTKRDFETKNRKKFCARIATGDYDAVIIGHSQFEKIPISTERQERLLREQIADVTSALDDLKRSRGEQFSIKQMEKTRKTLQARLEKLLAEDRKDDVITFEQLGVDRLFVDESQVYKNLFLFTQMRNVAGLSTSEAQRSSDMFMKCRYLDEITGGRGVIFASGTPVSNSMTELYTVMRYLQYGTLQQKGMTHFDCWASTFGETTTAIELAPEGTGYRARTRFAKFFNLPELMNLFKEVADIKTSDQLNLPVPEAVFETVVVQPSEIQKEMVAALSERAARVHSGSIDASEDNMLCITSDGRKIGLDQRLMNPLLPDDPGSKLNACVNNVFQIWQEGQTDRLTQLIFCDMSTPKGDGSFTVYDDIRSKLMAMGVPKEEVAFIHEADTEAKKKELFAKVRTGQVRLLLGSTQKMGAGTNVQDLLVAVHHLDVGWRPADQTQRNGRIIRQGNRNKRVRIFNYVTEGTFDAYLFQTLENKQRFISQIMTSKSPVRSCDDVDEQALSYAEIKALCAGDSRIKEKMDLDIDVARLKVLKADHQSQRFRLEDQLLKHFPAAIEEQQGFIRGFTEDMQTAAAHPLPQEGFVGMEVQGRTFTEKALAGEAILAACKSCQGSEPVKIGSYRGFKVELSYDSFRQEFDLTLKGSLSHRLTLGESAVGNFIRMDNVLAGLESKLEATKERLANLQNQQTAARAQLDRPFPQEEELRQKSARLAELDAELSMDEHDSGEPEQGGEVERPSVLADLKAKSAQIPSAKHRPGQEAVL